MHGYDDVWQALEDANDDVSAVADLYHWSTNYDAGRGPFTLFLDIIGWSADEIGEALYPAGLIGPVGLGYVECGKLAAALTEYADRPHEVRAFVDVLMGLESGA